MPAIVNSETTGMIKHHAGSTAPAGYLICNGAVVSQTTYASLFAIIGSTFNTGGEGVGNFRLPDLRGKAPIGSGQDSGRGLSNRTIGQYIGEENHILAQAELSAHTHSAGTMATETQAHAHSATTDTVDLNHTHSYLQNDPCDCVDGPSTRGRWAGYQGLNFQNAASPGSLYHGHTASTNAQAITHTHTLTTGNGDGVNGSAHNNMQPYLVLNYIIKY